MNICTKTWKGSDYMAAPAMAIKETNAAFDFAMELQRRNFPLSTISLWACGNNKLKAKDLVASLKTREMPQCLQEADGWCAKSRKWFEAASENSRLNSSLKVFDFIHPRRLQCSRRCCGLHA